MVSKLNYNDTLVKNLLDYSEKSSTGLIFKNGKEAGRFEKDSKGNKKAVRVSIRGTRYLVHRLIWTLVHGFVDPDLDIDHIDGNPWNNDIKNLRLVNKKQNQRNRRKMSNNKTGYNGVGLHTTPTGSGKFNTYVRVCWVGLTGRQSHKDFNIKNFKDIQDAAEFADLYRQMVVEDIETYTGRHGI